MCNLETEGTYFGCGHYKQTRITGKIDCMNPYCSHSRVHPNPCPNCRCDPYLGPDRREVITLRTPEYCDNCQYWYLGQGSGLQNRSISSV